MKSLKIGIIFGTKPNFNHEAFKYFILSVNKFQKTYEFFFPDVSTFPFEMGIVDFQTSHETANTFIQNNRLTADHFITIITNSFNNNFFFNARQRTSIITTDIWEKRFSPPSLFEYLLHCIYTCLIYSQVVPADCVLTNEQLIINIGSHPETKGCIADFTRRKADDRIDITLGFICEEHKELITKFYGTDYYNELLTIISREWIGGIEQNNSVAYNLKHIFKFNIYKDSGFNKTLWDKIKEKFYEIPGSITGEIIKIALTALLTYYLIKIGIIDKK
jgi:hypothetical protein